MSEYKCDCGKELVEYEGVDEDCNITADSAQWDFICEDQSCGKRYSVEFNNIGNTCCDSCDGSLGDSTSTEGNISIDCINYDFDCIDCGETMDCEFHPIHIQPISSPNKPSDDSFDDTATPEPKFNRYYVYMDLGWWSYSKHDWKNLVDQVVTRGQEEFEGFTLDDSKSIKNKPQCVKLDRYSNDAWSTKSDAKVVTPLKWDFNDFKAHKESGYSQ
ncbi:hypothetical protein VCHA53O466_40463 [Vibrio chagasii]|nr:hypothetical protein VCHA53O466_40463 [Vibrio chagasii]